MCIHVLYACMPCKCKFLQECKRSSYEVSSQFGWGTLTRYGSDATLSYPSSPSVGFSLFRLRLNQHQTHTGLLPLVIAPSVPTSPPKTLGTADRHSNYSVTQSLFLWFALFTLRGLRGCLLPHPEESLLQSIKSNLSLKIRSTTVLHSVKPSSFFKIGPQ